MRVVWIASYPKSGNTWVRFLLYHYFWGEPANSLEINRRIPDLHRPSGRIETASDRLFVKTHLIRSEALPFLAQTERAIVVTRHPKDVLLSGLNYARLENEAVDASAYARAFIAGGGDPAWSQMGFGTWAGHAASWLGGAPFPVHHATYEALKADPHAGLRAMLGFVGEAIDEAALARAVDLSGFERLREMERREKSRGAESLFRGGRASLSRGAMFMNKGATGQSLAHIDPALDAEFDSAFATPMARFGHGA
ncbi:MAG: sulfotransferase domain-containing protein [Phycisphaerales bacterium]|nr:sulfotransferase domain-containing protein [Phycisphaerales bacterium]